MTQSPHQNILWIECSPNGIAAKGRIVGQMIVDTLCATAPGARVKNRLLTDQPVPAIDDAFTRDMFTDVTQNGVPDGIATSEALIQELEAADALVISTPMHNFTVPAALKAWIDQVARINRAFRSTPTGKVGLLADRPTYVAVSSGGFVLPPRATQPDFLTPYLTAILSTMGIRSVSFFYLEDTKTLADSQDARLSKLRTDIEKRVATPVAVS